MLIPKFIWLFFILVRIILPSSFIYSQEHETRINILKEYKLSNFVLYTDSKNPNHYLNFFVSFKNYFSKEYVNLDNLTEIKIYLYENEMDYTAINKTSSDYGYYSSNDRRITTHSKAGLGTYTHELVHAFLDQKSIKLPIWFREGFPMFFEKIYGYYDNENELEIVIGFQNPWRVKSIISDSYKIPTVESIISQSGGLNEQSFLSIFLFENKALKKYFDFAIKKNSSLDQYQNILNATGFNSDELEKKWHNWMQNNINDAKRNNSELNKIPMSFVVNNKLEWEKIDKKNMHKKIISHK